MKGYIKSFQMSNRFEGRTIWTCTKCCQLLAEVTDDDVVRSAHNKYHAKLAKLDPSFDVELLTVRK